MYEARLASDWDHTAEMIAKIHNVNCTKAGDTVSSAQLNPFRKYIAPTTTFAEIKRRREESRNGG